jgi:HSP20 family protein
MALTRWEPFEGLTTLRRELDRLFEDVSQGSGSLRFWERAAEPAVEISDTAAAVVVKAQLPGVKKDDLQLTITENALTVKGEMKEQEKQEDKNYHRREFRYGAFVRTIALPVPVQAEKATAQLKDGVLEVTMPKSTPVKVQQIPIQAS